MMLVSFILLAGTASALPIEITDPTPASAATGVTPSATLAISSIVNSSNGSSMMGYMWTNISGVYAQGNWVGPFDNTTINWQMDASSYSMKYYWGVFANDSWGNSLNQSWNFTTEDAPVVPAPAGVGAVTLGIVGLVMVLVALGGLYFIYQIYFVRKKRLNMKEFLEVIYLIIILGVAETVIAVMMTMM
jgi:hypothetical protein